MTGCILLKFTMKWSLADLGAALATLQGREPQVIFSHWSEKANGAFELAHRDDAQRAPYMMRMSRRDEAAKAVRKVAIPVSHAEAAVLEAALQTAVVRVLGGDGASTGTKSSAALIEVAPTLEVSTQISS